MFVLIVLLILLTVEIVIYFLAVHIYKSSFMRYQTADTNIHTVKEFDGLKVSENSFTSNIGQRLACYTYYKENVLQKAILVFAHGMGAGGQTGYMELFDYFASNGFTVFAYDATGNDNSEGASVRGMPQGVIDLDYAVDYIRQDSLLKQYPVVLCGYSWGAYSVSCLLNIHKDIIAAVECSGFNSSLDLINKRGNEMLGRISNVLLPYIRIHERILFGRYAGYTAIKGFESSLTPVMVIHSEDDRVVPVKYGYKAYALRYKNEKRFNFKLYKDRGHEPLKNADGRYDNQLLSEIQTFYDEQLNAQMKKENI